MMAVIMTDATLAVLCPQLLHCMYRYVKFDTFHPAVDKGLPVTRVISRFVLQKLLAEACEKLAGDSIIMNNTVISDFEEKVTISRSLGNLTLVPMKRSLQK